MHRIDTDSAEGRVKQRREDSLGYRETNGLGHVADPRSSYSAKEGALFRGETIVVASTRGYPRIYEVVVESAVMVDRQGNRFFRDVEGQSHDLTTDLGIRQSKDGVFNQYNISFIKDKAVLVAAELEQRAHSTETSYRVSKLLNEYIKEAFD